MGQAAFQTTNPRGAAQLKQETSRGSRREQAWTSPLNYTSHHQRKKRFQRIPPQPRLRHPIQPRGTAEKQHTTSHASQHPYYYRLPRVQQKKTSTSSLGTTSKERTGWHNSNHPGLRSRNKTTTNHISSHPSLKMNRLFGAKSSAPKPTLNSAIANVCRSPLLSLLSNSSRSTNEYPQSTSSSPP